MYFGLDVHKAFIQVCKLGKDGEVKGSYRIGGDQKSIRQFAADLKSSDQVVLETTFNSFSVYSILRESKAKIVVSDSNQVKAIAHARVKTDKVDAEVLARLLRADFIPEVKMPSDETWSYRQLTSHLRMLSKNRTMIKNSIWGVLNKNLIKAPDVSDLFGKRGRKWLSELELNHLMRLQLDNLLNLLEANDYAISQSESELKKITEKKKDVQLLMSIPGVGMKVALGFISAIGDINRFDSPKKLASYFGLTPSISQSANREFKGSITKEGTVYGRWLAVEAAQSMALSGSPITASYFKIKNKRGHNVAVTALARKLIVVVWHMLKKQEPYRYSRPERVSEKLRVLHDDLPTRYQICQENITTEEIYKQAGLPKPSAPTEAEKRAAVRNKKAVTSNQKKKNPEAKQKVKSGVA